MNTFIYHLSQIYRYAQLILKQGYVNGNPIEIRLLSLLEEQRIMLEKIFQLRNPIQEKEHLHYYLSVVYRDDESAQPTFEDWKRVSIWMGSTGPILQQREEYILAIRHELKALVPIIQDIYGKIEAEFIIPPLIRS